MIWDRLSVLRTLFVGRGVASDVARRWRAARDPALAADILRLGGVLTLQPVRIVGGVPEVEPIDPQRLAYEAGRRDFAIQLLALMGLTITEINSLMENNDV